MKSCIRLLLLFLALGPVGTLTVHASPKPPTDMLDMTILTPRDGLALNAAALEIQALTRAHRARRGDDDVWTGWTRVDLAIDGVTTQTLDPTACRGELVSGFHLDLTGLAPGAHVATVTASKKPQRGTTVHGSASLNFTIDPTLPERETNRIEEAATPKPFGCLSTPDFDRDDDNRADDDDFRFATLRGSFVPNALSTGIDLGRDRVVLALDDQLVVIEPGSFVCRAHNRCRFTDRGAALVRSVRLEEKKNGRWTFTIATRHRPWSPHALFLRIGGNWGGLDFVRDQYVATLTSSPDTAHRATATIGIGGGTVQTTDALGVIITLSVPAGALTADTAITVTPQTASPLVGPNDAIHPGVDLEPDGLQFADAATLTFDFSHTSTPVTDLDAIFLLTSPMTALPLYGTVDPTAGTLTAEIHRFSDPQPGPGNAARFDAAWVNGALAAPGTLSLTELQSIYAVVTALQLRGQDGGINTALLTQRTQQTIDARVTNYCQYDVNNPTDTALTRWIDLDHLGQSLGVNTSSVSGCEERVLEALIVSVGARAQVTLANSDFQRLVSFESAARGLGFGNLETLAIRKLAAALRVLLGQGQQLCRTTSTVPAGQNVLNRAMTWVPSASALGVDPSLAGDIQSALSQCGGGGGQITAVVLGGSFAEGTFGICGGETPCTTFNEVSGDAGVPVTLSAPGLSVSVSQPSPNVIAIDVEANAVGLPRAGPFLVVLDISHAQPGQVSVVGNTQWGSACPVTNWAPDPAHPDALFISYGACPGGNFSGSGRLVTITFTPSP